MALMGELWGVPGFPDGTAVDLVPGLHRVPSAEGLRSVFVDRAGRVRKVASKHVRVTGEAPALAEGER